MLGFASFHASLFMFDPVGYIQQGITRQYISPSKFKAIRLQTLPKLNYIPLLSKTEYMLSRVFIVLRCEVGYPNCMIIRICWPLLNPQYAIGLKLIKPYVLLQIMRRTIKTNNLICVHNSNMTTMNRPVA